MAKPLSALQLLEDTVHLLRAAPFSTLAWHWIGSLPAALGAVYFWNEITHPQTAGPRLAADCLLLALLLAWLNLCRAVYSGRLRDQLAGIPSAPLTAAALWRIAPAQVWLGATKLVALPMALVSGILLAPTVAFYRNAAALAAREPDTRALTAQARRFARFEAAQNWRALGLLLCLYPLAFVNIVLTIAVLPQLARIVTGIESAYSRLGTRILDDSLFWTVAFAFTWVLFDPFVQAVYCCRCFQAESAETGEDVKAALRRLRVPAAAALLAVCCTFAVSPAARAQSVPQPDLDRAVQQAAQSSEYDWRTPPTLAQKQQPSWFVAATDRIVAATRAFLRSLSDAIGRFLRWIFGRPENIDLRPGAAPSTALPAGIWILILLVLAGAAFAFFRSRFPTRRASTAPTGPAAVPTSEDAEQMDPLRFPEQAWIDLAERALAQQDWRLAMRAFYLANLAWLGRREFLQIHSGKTNREYELELRKRTRTAPGARDLFSGNVAAFERVWYGMHALTLADVYSFRDRTREMQHELEAAS